MLSAKEMRRVAVEGRNIMKRAADLYPNSMEKQLLDEEAYDCLALLAAKSDKEVVEIASNSTNDLLQEIASSYRQKEEQKNGKRK